jgi:hypothetical protein
MQRLPPTREDVRFLLQLPGTFCAARLWHNSVFRHLYDCAGVPSTPLENHEALGTDHQSRTGVQSATGTMAHAL